MATYFQFFYALPGVVSATLFILISVDSTKRECVMLGMVTIISLNKIDKKLYFKYVVE